MKERIIKKRTIIDDSIIKELDEKYPPKTQYNGVVYEPILQYITLDPSDFNFDFNEYSISVEFGVFDILFFISNEIIKKGYLLDVSATNLHSLKSQICRMLNMDIDKVEKIINHLIEYRYLFLINHDGKEYLTSAQIVFDYERLSNKRLEYKTRQAKARAKRKAEEVQKPISEEIKPDSNDDNPDIEGFDVFDIESPF